MLKNFQLKRCPKCLERADQAITIGSEQKMKKLIKNKVLEKKLRMCLIPADRPMAVQVFASEKVTNLFNIALGFGYYDHAHFTNEFKLFMAMIPRDYSKNILNKGIIIN